MKGDTVTQIKDRLSITEVISPYVKLTRAGRSLRGLCPFHKEKTPSFHVSPERGTWHCFGCGLGGDAFSFIEKVEGVDFKGALRILAEKAGVPLEYAPQDRDSSAKKERLYALMAQASDWYQSQLKDSEAYTYAKSRGLTDESIVGWKLGYAPNAWRALLEALTAEGYGVAELLAVGLVKEAEGKQGTYYDRFRHRLLFPIRDSAGRVVAFTGRALDPKEEAKYLNSPETELFHKSSVLFGLDRAKDAIRTRQFTLLVEGQLDVLLSHQAGFTNAVALSGTALSETHLALMKRFSENLMLALDADSAGLRATARSAALALSQGLRVKVARLPKGKDPADLVNEDPKLLTQAIATARPVVEFFLAELASSESDPHRLLRSAEQIVLPLLRAMPSPMEREHFVQVTGRTLGLSSEAVRESLARLPRETVAEAPRAQSARPVARSAREVREEQVIAFIEAYKNSPLAEVARTGYSRVTGASEVPQREIPESVLFTLEQSYGQDPAASAVEDLLRAFEHAVIREAYDNAVHELRRAESERDEQRIRAAQEACATLSARLAALGKAST